VYDIVRLFIMGKCYQIMTLKEAKEFYFQYDGSSFHMDREEPGRYGNFKMLSIGKDVLQKWDEEILDGLFEKFRTEPENAWRYHERMIRIIRHGYCDAGKYLGMMLDGMDNMRDPDMFNVTLILENMAGRNKPMNDGGVHSVFKYSSLASRMNEVTGHLIAACSSANETDDRFDKAVNRYRASYKKWSEEFQA